MNWRNICPWIAACGWAFAVMVNLVHAVVDLTNGDGGRALISVLLASFASLFAFNAFRKIDTRPEDGRRERGR